MPYDLAIDVGTTWTAAAIARDGRVETVQLGTRRQAIPSVVCLTDERLLVGEPAARRAVSDPQRVAREFKRRVGDPTPLLLGGTPMSAELCMARVASWVVDQVAGTEGEPPRSLAMTHPANWGEYKLDLLRQALRHEGLDADHLVPEPVAAATAYAAERSLVPGSVVAVYDLGGGTFDAAVVRAGETPSDAEIVGRPDGIERLGGTDFDHAVFHHVATNVGLDPDHLPPDDPSLTSALVQLRAACVEAKEALSEETHVSIPVMLPGLPHRGPADPARARGDDRPVDRGDDRRAAPDGVVGRRRRRRRGRGAARRRIVAHPARRPAGRSPPRPSDRGGRPAEGHHLRGRGPDRPRRRDARRHAGRSDATAVGRVSGPGRAPTDRRRVPRSAAPGASSAPAAPPHGRDDDHDDTAPGCAAGSRRPSAAVILVAAAVGGTLLAHRRLGRRRRRHRVDHHDRRTATTETTETTEPTSTTAGGDGEADIEPLPGDDWNDAARAQFVVRLRRPTSATSSGSAGASPTEACGCIYDDAVDRPRVDVRRRSTRSGRPTRSTSVDNADLSRASSSLILQCGGTGR